MKKSSLLTLALLLAAASSRAGAPACDALVEAAGKGDMLGVSKLVREGASAGCRSDLPPYFTPLCSAGNDDTARVLLSFGADPNGACQYETGTPLSQAAERGDQDRMRLLLASPGIDVNRRAPRGEAPINAALTPCAGGRGAASPDVVAKVSRTVDLLLKAGATPFSKGRGGNNIALDALTLCEDVPLTLRLRSLGMPLRSDAGWGPFCDAAHWSDADTQARRQVLDLLIGDGNDVNRVAGRLEGPFSPLACAVWAGNLPLVDFLIKHNADSGRPVPATKPGVMNALTQSETPADLAQRISADPSLAWGDRGRDVSNYAAIAKLLKR